MNVPSRFARLSLLVAAVVAFALPSARADLAPGHYLLVGAPGVRDYLEYGGHGLLVFNAANNYSFVKRIPTAGVDEKGKPLNVKGICVSPALKRVFISTPQSVMAIDLHSEKLLWEKKYEGGCDRMEISPDGLTMYVPSFEGDHWTIVDARTGDAVKKIVTNSGAHNTVYGPDGREVYMGGLKSPWLFVADTATGGVSRKVGPFSGAVRPFTVNGRQTLSFVTINELLGFEIGDLKTGKVLHRVQVEGYSKGPVKRHGCPSHGIALTPDESEVWVCDSANKRLHIFDAKQMPPKQTISIELSDEPGWVTFSIDGTKAYPSTGQVIDVKSRRIITQLKDETGASVQSEKLVEIEQLPDGSIKAGDQFGIGAQR